MPASEQHDTCPIQNWIQDGLSRAESSRQHPVVTHILIGSEDFLRLALERNRDESRARDDLQAWMQNVSVFTFNDAPLIYANVPAPMFVHDFTQK